jgi:hypothetical protein
MTKLSLLRGPHEYSTDNHSLERCTIDGESLLPPPVEPPLPPLPQAPSKQVANRSSSL